MFSKKNWFLLGLFGLTTLILFARNFRYPETDYFWIVKGGEWILANHQIPHQDIWSYTLPNFPWIFHEWGSGVLMYLISAKFGFSVLSLLGCLLVSLTIFLSVPRKYILKYPVVLIIAAVFLSVCLNGFRPQQFTFFFAVFFLLFFWRYFKTQNPLWLILLPLLMIIWVNLHGGFFLGLGITFALIVLKITQKIGFWTKFTFFSPVKGKEIWYLIGILAALFLATLVNPYGVHSYGEVWRTIPLSTISISEWLPTEDTRFLIAIGIILAMIILFARKLPFEVVFVFLLSLGAIIIRKFIPILILFSLYPICLALDQLSNVQYMSKAFGLLRRARPWFWGALALIFLSLLKSGLTPVWEEPTKVVEYLKSQPKIGERMFNSYGFGGFLIANYPQQKVFIDGRMASWKDGDGYLAKDYLMVTKDREPYQQLFDKYGVDWAIISPVNSLDKKLVKLLTKDKNWQQIYSDNAAIIFKKIK